MNFSDKDINQIKSHGLTPQAVEEQTENFKKGFAPILLYKAATLGDGILSFSEEDRAKYISFYGEKRKNLKIKKFVPASGAATRMMKDLYSFVSEYKDEISTPLKNFPAVEKLLLNIEKFAFFSELQDKMKQNGEDLNSEYEKKNYKNIVEYILLEKGLNYGKSPKAWIVFHRENITPFEEHLAEAEQYCKDLNGRAAIEFSIQEDHLQGFEMLKERVQSKCEKNLGVKYDITFSFQQKSTDTVAVDMENNPIHDKNGDLVFRPAGHGALIRNISNLDADVVFIKNIDNVSSRYRQTTYEYKKFLGGLLLELKEKTAELLSELEKTDISRDNLTYIYNRIKKDIFVSELKRYEDFNSEELYREYLKQFLDRPLRVCGMVKNEGEPGGGPFFVKKSGEVSLQIVEKAQVDLEDASQKDLFMKATHFNPVDLVLSLTDAKGKKYDLERYIDKETGFISVKSFEGKDIKAMERPGLWNGAMAGWLTVFAQVPSETFSPVKTINDLLKEPHQ